MRQIQSDGSVQDVVSLSGSNIMQPVDIQSRLATTIQTHNAVSISGSGGSSVPSTFIDCNGYDQLAVTLLNDATTNTTMEIWWSNDNVNTHGKETILATGGGQQRPNRTSVKARYAKLVPINNDTVSHTMSSWAYLLS